MSSKNPLKSIDSSLSAYNFEENHNNFLFWGKKFTECRQDSKKASNPCKVTDKRKKLMNVNELRN